ncbi:MAG: hypothetical protein HC897_15230 [Thermoanaerobaculia bacterium]|nr:hypothetical protein [Thermoanaerobaculia bacterium]
MRASEGWLLLLSMVLVTLSAAAQLFTSRALGLGAAVDDQLGEVAHVNSFSGRTSTNRGWDTGIYSYDGAGNVKQIGTQVFRYDRFKRMTSGEVTVGSQDRVQSASYDVYNNLLALTTNGSTLTTTVNTATNRLTSFSATYDAAGNLTRQVRGSETHQYTYDPLGMLKYLQSSTDEAQVYLYDADDERLATYDCFPNVCNTPGWELRTTVRGLGGEPLREYSTRGTNGWQWVRDYIYGAGGLLAAAETDGEGGEDVDHFHRDHLGTPRQITNASGVQVALHSYYPFGQEATDPAQTSFTKKFTGHERDTNGTGTAGDLDYMHARYCSPTLGRFLSFDPIGGNPRAPQSWNRYAYALNSPMNYTDPEGMKPVATFKVEIFVFDSAPPGFEIPSWLLDNLLIDVTPHFNNSRFDLSQQTFSAWKGWDGAGCDFWCQVFTEVGSNSLASNYVEFGASNVFLAGILGPLFSRTMSVAPYPAGTEVVQRAMSRAELAATKATNLLRGGRGGTHFVSDSVSSIGLRARQRLALPQTPELRVTMEVPVGRFSRPSRVAPTFNMPGGGMERTAVGDIPVRILRVEDF